jgi:hypothetical protein
VSNEANWAGEAPVIADWGFQAGFGEVPRHRVSNEANLIMGAFRWRVDESLRRLSNLGIYAGGDGPEWVGRKEGMRRRWIVV